MIINETMQSIGTTGADYMYAYTCKQPYNYVYYIILS